MKFHFDLLAALIKITNVVSKTRTFTSKGLNVVVHYKIFMFCDGHLAVPANEGKPPNKKFASSEK